MGVTLAFGHEWTLDKRSDYRMLDERECFVRYDSLIIFHQPPWRNRLARSAVNRKVGGSSPPGGAIFSPSEIIFGGKNLTLAGLEPAIP